jgi:hypothetical protein
MPSVAMVSARARWTLVAAAAAGTVGEVVRRRRSARDAPPPPLTTQSSPGQIADLQQEYGAEMGPPSASRPDEAASAG